MMHDGERRALLVKTYNEGLEVERRRRRRKVAVGTLALLGSGGVWMGARAELGRERVVVENGVTEASVSDGGTNYYVDRSRVAYRGGDVRAACPQNDDDERFLSRCPGEDYKAWCGHPERTGPGTRFHEVCGAACEEGGMAWAMVCAWQAVAHLEKVCDGTFAPTPPTASSRNSNSAPWAPEFGRTATGAKLYGCDEHAVCSACFHGQGTSGETGEMCERVAAHYGGYGRLDGPEETERGFTGAEAAFEALAELDKWCESFDESKELAERRAFDMVPAWVNGFGGDDGVSGEYVQRWGSVGGELVEEHVIRDQFKHDERFSQDAYAYWRYVLADPARLDAVTHVHTSVTALQHAVVNGRVQRGAVIFLDVLYAVLDVEHFPLPGDTSLGVLGWTADMAQADIDRDPFGVGVDDDTPPAQAAGKEEEDIAAAASQQREGGGLSLRGRGGAVSSSVITEEMTAADDPSPVDELPIVESLRRSCLTPASRLQCQRRLNKECVYQFSDNLLLRSTTLRMLLSYHEPLTLVIAGDLSCQLGPIPVTHHQLIFANDGALTSSVDAYNAQEGVGGPNAPRAAWFPFGLEGVEVLSNPRASALDAASSGARLSQPAVGLPLSDKEFFLGVDASLNRRKPSRNALYKWLESDGGSTQLESLRKHASGAGKLPISIKLVDNRPPYGADGFAKTVGKKPLEDAAEMMRRTVFSVAPAGDFWTSGRVLEALMLNSVPVVDATYALDGGASTKGCADPAKFWRQGDDTFPRGAPFIFVDDWARLPDLLAPYANDPDALDALFRRLDDYRSALEKHLAALPLALKRRLDGQDKAPGAVSQCTTIPLTDAEHASIIDDARDYYSNPRWYDDYVDSPSNPGVGCTKYTEIRDMYPEYGAVCFSDRCVPPMVHSFSCEFVQGSAPDS